MSNIIQKKADTKSFIKGTDITSIPSTEKYVYKNRLGSICEAAERKGLTHIIVYGDKEHFSNIHFLTGFDPRFEEALLIIPIGGIPVLMIGNEGLGYTDDLPVKVKRELFQSFSLVSQPRGRSKTFRSILAEAGIKKGSKIGTIGWKYFCDEDSSGWQDWIEIPHYMVEELSDIAGRKNITNVTDLMQHPGYGLRVFLDTAELVKFEVAGTKASRRVKNVIDNLKPGMSEMEASEYLCLDGEPLCTHPNVNFGIQNVMKGLASPSRTKKLEIGDAVAVGIGYRRALVHRVGTYAKDESQLHRNVEDSVEKLYKPYFNAMSIWYESIKIGVTGGEVFENVRKAFGSFVEFGVSLNPGHLIHTDEWVSSLFFSGSHHRICSGMAIQCDIIACPGAPYSGAHIEDGIIIADSKTREEIKTNYPDCWERIQERRIMMKEQLGIVLADEVLPTSDIQAVFNPFLADVDTILSKTI